jgi:amino acid permease
MNNKTGSAPFFSGSPLDTADDGTPSLKQDDNDYDEFKEVLPEELSGEEGEGHGKHENRGKSSIFMASMNIVNTIIGAGILDLPYVISQFGILIGSLIIILSWFLTYISCVLLLKAKNLSRHSKFSSIGVYIFKSSGEKIIKGVIIVNNFGLCIVYLIIFGQVTNKLAIAAGANNEHFYFQQWFLIIVVSMIMLPFIFTKSMNSLKSLSFLAVSGICIFSVITIYNFIKTCAEGNYDGSTINFFPSSDLNFATALSSVPSVILAFTFQFNFFPVYKSLNNPTDKTMKFTTFFALSMACTLYLIVAIMGYLSFGSSVSDQGLLENFSSDNLGLPLYVIVLITFSMSSTFTFPLMFFGARENIYSFILEAVQKYRKTHPTESLSDSLMTEPKEILSKPVYVGYCLGLYALTIFFAIVTPSITVVFDFVGSIAANSINYLLPAIFYWKLTKNVGIWKKISGGLVIYGVVIGFVCLISSIISVS